MSDPPRAGSSPTRPLDLSPPGTASVSDDAQPVAERPERRPGRQLLAGSATVSLFNGLGVLAGFALDALVAALFGVGLYTDAFFSAWRLPYLITTVLTMAANATLVPVFARELVSPAQAGAALPSNASAQQGTGLPASDPGLSDFFSRVFNAVVLLLALLAGLGVLFSPWLVSALFGGLPAESVALAASLSRILFLTVFFTGAVEVLRSALYAHQIFGLPTAINFVRSGVVIVIMLVGLPLIRAHPQPDIAGLTLLAWGYVAGVCAQLLLLAWQTARRTALRWRPRFDLAHPSLRRLARLSAAPTAGAVLRQGINLAETVIASYLPPGSVTILNYANRLTFVVSSVFLSSVTTASMPMLSQALSAGRRQQVRQTLLSALRLVTFLALPLGIGLAFLGVPVIRLLLERGRFSPEASQVTGAVLSLYALSILCLGYFRVVQAYFYAALKAGTVLVLFLVMAVVTIGLDLALAPVLGVQGIALGFSLATLLVTVLGLWQLAREDLGLGEVDARGRRPLRALAVLNLKVGLAALLMALATVGLLAVLPATPWSLLPALLAGGAVFLVLCWLLHVDELQLAFELVRGRRTSQ